VVYMVGTCRDLYGEYMSWFIYHVHVVVSIDGTCRAYIGGTCGL
jgi:hypothetical protein